MDDLNDDRLDPEFTDALRAAFTARAATVVADLGDGDGASRWSSGASTSRRPTARRVRAAAWLVAAGLVVAAGVASVRRVGVDRTRGPASTASTSTAAVAVTSTTAVGSTGPASSTPATASSTGASIAASPAFTTIALNAPLDVTPWVVPTWLPDGLQLLDLRSSSTQASPAVVDPSRHGAQWIQRAADGRTIVASVDIEWLIRPGARADSIAQGSPDRTVHGHPGWMSIDVDPGRYRTASWWQPGLFVFLNTFSVDQESFSQLLDSLTVTGDGETVVVEPDRSLLDGFEPAHRDWSIAAGVATAAGETVTIVGRLEGAAGAATVPSYLSITAGPARTTEPLDATVVGESRRVVIDGIERSISSYPGDADVLPSSRVEWRVGGRDYSMYSTLALDDPTLDRIVAGLRLVDRATARAALDREAAALLATPALATATAAGGMVLSAYGPVGHPIVICAVTVGPSVRGCAADPFLSANADTLRELDIALGDRRLAVGWSALPLTGLTMVDGGPVEVIDTGEGWFAVLPDPAVNLAMPPGIGGLATPFGSQP